MRRFHAVLSFMAIATMTLSFSAGCTSMTGAEGLELEDEETPGGVASEPASAECVYPTEGFSTKIGGVIPDRKWQGFVDESMSPAEIALSDYYDCDGEKGVNALLVDVSATWCPACQAEAQMLNNELKTQWDALGIHVITLMIEDAASNPATPDTALDWKNQFKLTTSTVAADPQFTFAALASGGTIGLPFLIVIDPRTMTLVSTSQGVPPNASELTALAVRNQDQ